MTYFLGIDIGTTSTKAVAYNNTGDVLFSSAADYETFYPQPGWSEQRPDDVLTAVINSINTIIDQLDAIQPMVISFSAAMHSLIPVDVNGTPLSNCIIWSDNRSASIADALRNTDTGQNFYKATGVPIHSMSPFAKLLWLKANDSDLFTKAFKFIGIKEYVFFKLTGKYIVDTSIASATGLLNNVSLQWDDNIMAYAGIQPERLSVIVRPDFISHHTSNYPSLKLAATVPLVTGASDGALSNLGAVGYGNDGMVVSIGTSAAVRLITKGAATDPLMRTFCYHFQNDQYLIGGAGNNGAIVLQWLKEDVLKDQRSFEDLIDEAATVAAGSEGLLMLPYLSGERAPLWNASAKGIFFGMSIRHTQAHFVRAAMEAVLYGANSIAKILEEKKPVDCIHVSGGFTKSKLWLQMLADIFNKKVMLTGANETAAWGAVILGAAAMSTPLQVNNIILGSFEPNAANHAVYKKCLEKFDKLYLLLKDEMTVNE